MAQPADREIDPEQLLDRLQNLRTIVPVFAQELASARRQAAHLRRENGRLVEQVQQLQQLQRQRIGRGRARGRELVAGATPDTRSVHASKGAPDAQHAHTVARLG